MVVVMMLGVGCNYGGKDGGAKSVVNHRRVIVMTAESLPIVIVNNDC